LKPIRGKAWVFEDHINADVAIGYSAALGGITDPGELKQRCMIGYKEEFPEKMRPGDIIVAGRNFACGNLHPQFNLSLKGAGVGGIVAQSFSRGFFRAAIYEGIISVECEEILSTVKQGDELEIDLEHGRVRDLSSGITIPVGSLPEYLLDMLAAGGLVPFLRRLYENSDLHCA
jgi:3-isopropylmalate/(R)-2-methylmalate dehydratase small subunit